MISLRNHIFFLFTVMILLCGEPLKAQVATDDDILDLIVPILSKTINNPPPNFSRKNLSVLAKDTGVSLSKIQRIVIANATDPFTPPNLKTECTSIAPINLGWGDIGSYCTAYTTYKQVMNCEWYIDATIVGDSTVFYIKSDEISKTFINNIANYVVERIKAAIDRTLVDSAVSSLISGISTGGIGATTAFSTRFLFKLNPELQSASNEIINYIKNFEFIKVSSFPDVSDFNSIKESCGWSEWTPL